MSDVLQTMSDALAEAVKTAGSSVVQVNARRRMPASGVVWSEDGVIVTANHIVKRDDKITISLGDDNAISAELVGRDPTTDLAVLRADGQSLAKAPWAESNGSTMGVGHLVLALGRPGRTVQATMGIISALSEDNWRTPAGGLLDRYLQTDVVMYPGFSGGPLVDVSGQILGINSSALVRGVSLTIPSATVAQSVESLLSHGHIRRGYLGVSTQPVRIPSTLKDQVSQETGLLIVAVGEDSPAEKGGLLLGDTIIGLDGNSVGSYDDLIVLMSADRVGQKVLVNVVRGGALQEVNVEIGERE